MNRLLAAGIAVAALAAAGAATAAATGDGPERGPARPSGATAPVTRGDLVDTKTVDGTLTFAGERKVAAGTSGVVTAVPRPGRVLRQGDVLYRVDRRPVVLLHGTLPLYRTLAEGTDGPDVTQLERALRALGHGSALTVDRRFTPATARAVRDWQDDVGLPETGTVDAAQAVFLPSPVRVAAVGAAVGDRVAPGHRMLTLTGTRPVVHVDLKVSDRALARANARVTVELPGGGTRPGRVARVGGTAEKARGDGQQEPTVDVEIELTGGRDTGGLDRAPVTVTLERERRRDVLTVPVEALLALRGGGYGVEVVAADGSRRRIPVRTGAYGGDRVEVSGTGLTEGTRVGVPAR
ncbi:efflux RND transporter periplasmic adaptor subunit [Actinomadura kijaniata]|uniref:efflux RND transporter periplasmic adaptor subunit n=1 Tax=Actinomadura kijaniata TaxID=46161 RepID=UPI003F1B9D78